MTHGGNAGGAISTRFLKLTQIPRVRPRLPKMLLKGRSELAFLSTIPALSRALAERNYASATPVQTAVLEAGAADRDLLVSAQTGSGKTVAYGLAIADNLFPPSGALGPPPPNPSR